MIETRSKEELLLIPGVFKMVACVLTHDRAAALADKYGYHAWYWHKRSQRLYGKVKPPVGSNNNLERSPV